MQNAIEDRGRYRAIYQGQPIRQVGFIAFLRSSLFCSGDLRV